MDQRENEEKQRRDDGRLVRRTIVTEEYVEVEEVPRSEQVDGAGHDLGRVEQGPNEARRSPRRGC